MASVRVTWVEVSVPEPSGAESTRDVSAAHVVGAFTQTVAAERWASASASQSVAVFSQAASGEAWAQASAAQSVDAFGQSANAEVVTAVDASAAQTIGSFTQTATVYVIQRLIPASDVAAAAWLPSAGGDLYAMIDETVADGADFIYTDTSASTCEVALTAGTDPSVSTGHTVTVEAYSEVPTGTLTTTVVVGTTVIASWTDALTGGAQIFSHTLSNAQADAITNYADLRLRFTHNA